MTESSHILYTIGHGARKAEDFLALLKQYGIRYLADVRSKPYSRFHPQFSQAALRKFLEENGIRYVFMGDELGGRPSDPSCYDDKGNIDYNCIRTKEYYRNGISRLRAALEKDLRLAIMCSERDPAMCHRTRLVAETMAHEGFKILHIDEKGGMKDHAEVMETIRRKNSSSGNSSELPFG